MDIEAGTERDLLEAHLDSMRENAIRKVEGLTWAEATRRLGPSATSGAGVLKHLIEVERFWFPHQLEGRDDVTLWSTPDHPDRDFELTPADDLQSLIDAYRAACADSRTIAARHSLDDQCVRAGQSGHHPSLRWIYIHLVEEIARHNGHLDIYREVIDGSTGRWLDDRRMP